MMQRVKLGAGAVSQSRRADKDREDRVSLGENHENVLRSPRFPARGTGREQGCAVPASRGRMQLIGPTKLYRKSGFVYTYCETAPAAPAQIHRKRMGPAEINPRLRKFHDCEDGCVRDPIQSVARVHSMRRTHA